ncbi:MAG TPA: hypothetical protein VMA72_07275 [Streptosporangiaceae bacterium]|nr:hypothetical protein [Streptosporangiaceae bacterium]
MSRRRVTDRFYGPPAAIGAVLAINEPGAGISTGKPRLGAWFAFGQLVAARNNLRGAVAGGEVIQRPDRGQHDVAVAWQRTKALLVVQDLGAWRGQT